MASLKATANSGGDPLAFLVVATNNGGVSIELRLTDLKYKNFTGGQVARISSCRNTQFWPEFGTRCTGYC
jgi:hypothetical protein